MEINSWCFGILGIIIVIGDFFEIDIVIYFCFDVVFIGGYGGWLKEIIFWVWYKFFFGVCIVFNFVFEESKMYFIEVVNEFGFCFFGGIRVVINEYNLIEILVVLVLDFFYL